MVQGMGIAYLTCDSFYSVDPFFPLNEINKERICEIRESSAIFSLAFLNLE